VYENWPAAGVDDEGKIRLTEQVKIPEWNKHGNQKTLGKIEDQRFTCIIWLHLTTLFLVCLCMFCCSFFSLPIWIPVTRVDYQPTCQRRKSSCMNRPRA
jgi:hypothetical protein